MQPPARHAPSWVRPLLRRQLGRRACALEQRRNRQRLRRACSTLIKVKLRRQSVSTVPWCGLRVRSGTPRRLLRPRRPRSDARTRSHRWPPARAQTPAHPQRLALLVRYIPACLGQRWRQARCGTQGHPRTHPAPAAPGPPHCAADATSAHAPLGPAVHGSQTWRYHWEHWQPFRPGRWAQPRHLPAEPHPQPPVLQLDMRFSHACIPSRQLPGPRTQRSCQSVFFHGPPCVPAHVW